MKNIKIEKWFGVDAGNISVIAGELCEKESLWNEIIDVEPGKYHVAVYIENTWNDEVLKEGTVETKSGKLCIGDCCYVFEDGWMNFLEGNDYLQNDQPNAMFVSTGGDGEFFAKIMISKL